MQPRRTPLAIRLPPHGVMAWESRHDPAFRMSPERHPFVEIFYVLDGAGWFAVGRGRHPARAGDVVVAPPRVPHTIEDAPKNPLSLYGICLSPKLLAADPAALARLGAGPVAVRPAVAGRVRAALRRLLFEQTAGGPGSRAMVVGLALQLVATLGRAGDPGGDPPRADGPGSARRRAVDRYLAELPRRFYEPATLDKVAADLGMSRRCFTRLFRAAAGRSWAQHLEAVRVEYACRLLRETARGVTGIAFEAGFEDLSSFYRAFKRRVGVPPGRWRLAGGGG